MTFKINNKKLVIIHSTNFLIQYIINIKSNNKHKSILELQHNYHIQYSNCLSVFSLPHFVKNYYRFIYILTYYIVCY